MDGAQVVTATIGALGILATVGVAIFTQTYQGRRQAERDERAVTERRAERWEQQRFEAYRRLLAAQHDLRTSKVRRDGDPEMVREHRSKIFAMDRLISEVYLIAPPSVAQAISAHDRAQFDAQQAWEEWIALPKIDPDKASALERLREMNRAEGEARRAMEEAIRLDLRPT